MNEVHGEFANRFRLLRVFGDCDAVPADVEVTDVTQPSATDSGDTEVAADAA